MVKLIVTQTNQDEQRQFMDENAELLEFEGAMRIVYSEDDHSLVRLDVSDTTMVLKRSGDWKTHAVFDKDMETKLHIISEEGVLTFAITVETFVRKPQSLYVKYHVSDNKRHIETRSIRYTWQKEEVL